MIIYSLWIELKRVLFNIKHTAEMDITDNCNLRCKHCYHFQNKEDMQTKEVPLHIWENRFNKLYSKGIRNVLLVGGEPALRQDILLLADKIFPMVHVITNGTIKIPKVFDHLLFLSIDGDEKTNDQIRGKNSFSRAIQNYKNDKRVIINITLTKDNYNKLENVINIARAYKLRGVVCNIYIHKKEKNIFQDQIISKEERQKIIRELKRVKRLYPKILLLTNDMIRWFEYPDHTNSCYWREQVLHYDVSFNRRKCFIDADCSDCGCFAGARGSFFSKFFNAK